MNLFIRTAAASFALITWACDAADKKPASKDTSANTNVKIEDLSKLSKEELAKKLDKEAYYVCMMGGTERPFENKYWNNREQGIYVDVISGKPLFASTHKFESRSGWPSFFEPLDKDEIIAKVDTSHGMERTEVISKTSGAHLGHLFDDGFDYDKGKKTPTGMRYCINSAALKFVPANKLKEAGLEKYEGLFKSEEKPKATTAPDASK